MPDNCSSLADMAQTHLDAIARAQDGIARAVAARNDAIRAARMVGESWPLIAAAAGMTRQGAMKAAKHYPDTTDTTED